MNHFRLVDDSPFGFFPRVRFTVKNDKTNTVATKAIINTVSANAYSTATMGNTTMTQRTIAAAYKNTLAKCPRHQ